MLTFLNLFASDETKEVTQHHASGTANEEASLNGHGRSTSTLIYLFSTRKICHIFFWFQAFVVIKNFLSLFDPKEKKNISSPKFEGFAESTTTRLEKKFHSEIVA